MKFILSSFRWYSKQLDSYPIRTKCITSGFLAANGDMLCQYLQFSRKRTHDEANFRPEIIRISRFGFLGCFLVAPIVHYWYGALMRRIPGQSLTAVFQRTFLDQFFFSPLFVPLFVSNLMILEGRPWTQIPTGVMEKLPSTLLLNWTLWIPAQIINFAFVPLKYQVLFSNFIGFIWNAILSWKMQNES